MALSVSIEHPCVTLLFQNTRSIRTAGYCCCDVLHPMLDKTQGCLPLVQACDVSTLPTRPFEHPFLGFGGQSTRTCNGRRRERP